jgi:Insect cuticle protein
MLKFVVFSCLLSVAFAGFVNYYQPNPIIVKEIRHHVQPEAPANYEFSYDVNEHSTGDVKSQQESAKNGVITGSYQLNDADGYRRIVDYTADDYNGFQATVRREPLHAHPVIIKKVIQPTIIKKIIAAPAHNPWQQVAHRSW